MMNSWQITKYNPKNRNEKGAYTVNEWTSISDVGNTYNNKNLTLDEYLIWENKYVDSILFFVKKFTLNSFKVMGLEKFGEELTVNDNNIYTQIFFDIYKKLKEGEIFTLNELPYLCKLILREKVWFKITSTQINFEIRFGYDYYMYVSCENRDEGIINQINEIGMFAEEIGGVPYSE